MNDWHNQRSLDPDSIMGTPRMSPMMMPGHPGTPFGPPQHQQAVHTGCLSLPYPPAVAKCPSPQSIRLIRGAYCGVECSELSALMQFFYHSMILEECAPQASAELMKISICEMHHLHLLGKLLCSMGSTPKFFAPRRSSRAHQDCWWTAQPPSVNYTDQMKEAICADIEVKKKAIADYQRIVAQCNDPGIVQLIERIILDEEEHLRIFSALLQRFCG